MCKKCRASRYNSTNKEYMKKRYHDDLEFRERAKAYQKQPEVRLRKNVARRYRWRTDTEFRDRIKAYRSRPDVLARERGYRKTDEHRARRRIYRKQPYVRLAEREYARRPEQKLRQQQFEREYLQRPEVKARRYQYRQTPEQKRKSCEYARRPDVRERARIRRNSPENKWKFLAYSHFQLQKRLKRKSELPNDFTRNDWAYALEYFGGCCAICGRQLNDMFSGHTAAMDHWIPLNSPDCLGTVPSNIVPLCHGIGGCNNSKGKRDPLEWLEVKFGKAKARHKLTRIQQFFETVRKL